MTQNRTLVLLLISYYQLIRYESSCGHKIEGVTPKQTGNEHGQRKQKKRNKQGRKQTEGSGCKGHLRQEGTQKRKPRNKRQTKRNKQRITTYNRGRKNVLLARLRKKGNHRSSARQPSLVRKTRTRTTNAPLSEKKEEGKGDSNQVKIKE